MVKKAGVLLFISILLSKTFAFHIYEHHDAEGGHEDHCELCFMVLDCQQSEILAVAQYGVLEKIPSSHRQNKTTLVGQHITGNKSVINFFSRPPPST